MTIRINSTGDAFLPRKHDTIGEVRNLNLCMQIFQKRWCSVRERAKSHPEDIRGFRDENFGCTALHLLLNEGLAPSYVTKAVFDAYPDAVFALDNLGNTPLHVASYAMLSSDDLRDIIHRNPFAITAANAAGVTPLDRVSFLLEEAVNDDYNTGGEPFFFLRCRSKALERGKLRCNEDYAQENPSLCMLWDNLHLLLRAAYHGTTAESSLLDRRTFRLVHACAGVWHATDALLRIAIRTFPGQLSEFDEDGNLPLHVAARTTWFGMLRNKELLAGNALIDLKESMDHTTKFCGAGQQREEGEPMKMDIESTPSSMQQLFHYDWNSGFLDSEQSKDDEDTAASSPDDDKLDVNGSHACDENTDDELMGSITVLLDAFPEAARVPNKKTGKLPLHIVIEHRMPWTCAARSLLEAYPGAITVPDSESRLVPFMMAAVEDKAHLWSVYQLLRSCPEVERFIGLDGDD